jgi:hypothetical protein
MDFLSFRLDTDIGSTHVNRPAGLTRRFVRHAGRPFIPTIGQSRK